MAEEPAHAAEAVREGEEVARERDIAQAELERTLMGQKGATTRAMSGGSIGSAGAGVEPDNSWEDDANAGPTQHDNVELRGDERMFEGEGRRPLSEQSSDPASGQGEQ